MMWRFLLLFLLLQMIMSLSRCQASVLKNAKNVMLLLAHQFLEEEHILPKVAVKALDSVPLTYKLPRALQTTLATKSDYLVCIVSGSAPR